MGAPLWPWNGPFHGHGSSIGGCIVHLSPFIPNGKCHGIALGFLIGHSMGKALLWALHGCLPHGHGMGHSMDKALLWWLHGCLPQAPFPCPCHGIALGFLIGHSMGKALLWAFHGCPYGHGMGHSMGMARL